MSKLKAVSLFCGCGGTDVGLKGDFEFLGQHYSSNGVDIVFANDIEPKAIDILEKNFASICTETVGIGKLIIRNYDQETARLLLILSKNGVQVKNMQNVTETLEEYYSKLI